MGLMMLADKIHTGEPLGVEMAVEKLKRYKSPGTDQIPAEAIQAGSSTMLSEILTYLFTYLLTYLLHAAESLLRS